MFYRRTAKMIQAGDRPVIAEDEGQGPAQLLQEQAGDPRPSVDESDADQEPEIETAAELVAELAVQQTCQIVAVDRLLRTCLNAHVTLQVAKDGQRTRRRTTVQRNVGVIHAPGAMPSRSDAG